MPAKDGRQLLHNKGCMLQQIVLVRLMQLLIVSSLQGGAPWMLVSLLRHDCHPLCQLVHGSLVRELGLTAQQRLAGCCQLCLALNWIIDLLVYAGGRQKPAK